MTTETVREIINEETGKPPEAATEVTLAIETVQTHVARFDAIGAGLAALEREHPKDVVLAVTTPEGMASAIESRRAWREPRIALEKARKAAKAPVLDLGRKIDTFAGDLEEKLREGEDHYDAQIKAEEGRKEAIRQQRLQAEAERVAGLRATIVRVFVEWRAQASPDGLRPTLAKLQEVRNAVAGAPADCYGDLAIEAEEAKRRALEELDQRLVEAADLERQRAELAEQRARDAAAAEERRAAEALQRQEETAEHARVRAAEDAERQVRAAELADLAAQIAAQRADLDRREAEAREAERVRQQVAEVAERRRAEVAAQIAAEASLTAQLETERAAAAQAAEAAAAGAMHDLLSDWHDLDQQQFDADGVLDELRQRRDRILDDLRGVGK